jgi:hypothetical protein
MPAVRQYHPGQQSYRVEGSIQQTDPYGRSTTSRYQGTVQPKSQGVMSGFAAGAAAGQQDAAARRAQEERQRVYRGCMYSLGWHESR